LRCWCAAKELKRPFESLEDYLAVPPQISDPFDIDQKKLVSSKGEADMSLGSGDTDSRGVRPEATTAGSPVARNFPAAESGLRPSGA